MAETKENVVTENKENMTMLEVFMEAADQLLPPGTPEQAKMSLITGVIGLLCN